MEIVRVLSMAVESAGRARGIKPSDEIHLSALRWETYSALQNLLDALSMLASTLGLRKPSSYAELGIILREGGILDEGDAELVGRVARSRNLLAHAYRRMSGEELMEMVEALLPGVEDMAGRLMGEVERRGIDPEGMRSLNPSGSSLNPRRFSSHISTAAEPGETPMRIATTI